MFERIISFSVNNRGLVLVLVAFLIGGGIFSLRQLPLDAVPDITSNQVQIVTVSPSLAPEEVERFITYPLELSMGFIPNVIEIRSISKFGLSILTVVFEEDVDMLDARQLVQEQIKIAEDDIPNALGTPELMPITTGLGEIYQYTLQVDSHYAGHYSNSDLRAIQDWIVKRQFTGTEGIVEVSSFGGYLKEYEVAVDPLQLRQFGLTLPEVNAALKNANQNSGAGLIQNGENSFYLRTEGLLDTREEIGQVILSRRAGGTVLVKHVAEIREGHAPRFGAMSMDGKGEVVGGITLMLRGANSSEVIDRVHDRINEIQKSLPSGIRIVPYLDRSLLVDRTITTVTTNLIEGGLVVILVLVIFLGNLRSGLIVASIIPLSMMFAFIMMRLFGVSANLMSLGAIDFGIVVDGAVIIVEHLLFMIHRRPSVLREGKFNAFVAKTSGEIYRSAAFGVLIILVVFIPVLSLEGIEGKMFQPMAQTFMFVILGALLLSLTYVPAISAFVFKNGTGRDLKFSETLIEKLKSWYEPLVRGALRLPVLVFSIAMISVLSAILLFARMGQEFLPQLEEGDLAVQMALPVGSGLEESLRFSQKVEQRLLDKFPEVEHVISKIGAAEIPTDPMSVEQADIMVILKPKDEWTSAKNRDELSAKMKESLMVFKGLSFEFTQPIQLRFNELMTGSKADIAIKIFGENPAELSRFGQRAEDLIRDIPGVGDVKVEQTSGLSQIFMELNRQGLARYGIEASEVQSVIRTAYSGEKVGTFFEDERKFDLVVRLDPEHRKNPSLTNLFVRSDDNHLIPVDELVNVDIKDGPAEISRDQTKRRINVGVNVRNRDLASVVEDIQQRLDEELRLPSGYHLHYGGQFENLQSAKKRLLIAVPIALALILVLLNLAFGSMRLALLIFASVPLSLIGGVAALWLRDLPFSISAGIGFITLFGVSVLNGIVMINHFQELMVGKLEQEKIVKGALDRLRPVLTTAITTIVGFLPMALSTGAGAEVQRPLATVVIGGLFSATLLTLLVLPVLYQIFHRPVKSQRNLS
jgi:cobalt-zinc-cadmium resistance protein CzcA